jgi:Flp pilus assembly protein protease CpaA
VLFEGIVFGAFSLFLWIGYQDIRYGKIPNICLGALAVLLVYYLATTPSLLPHLQAGVVGILLVALVLFLCHWNAYVGCGDLKLFALGCFFTTPSTLPIFMISSGIVALLLHLLYKTVFKKKVIPLGPALMGGMLIVLFLR